MLDFIITYVEAVPSTCMLAGRLHRLDIRRPQGGDT